jgi:tetratricopeptide (TPR) repeat protein
MTDNLRIDDLRRRVQKDPASIAFAQLAEEYRRSGQYAEAAEVCRGGLAIHPGYLSARVTLGRALIELGDLPAARTELEIVLRGAPENLSAIRGLAEIHHRLGDLPAALAQNQAALRLAPNDPDLEQSVGDLTREIASSARSEPDGHAPEPVSEPSDPPADAERDRAMRTVAALEEFLAAFHAEGANRKS